MSDIPRVRRELEGLMAAAGGGDLTLPRPMAIRWLKRSLVREPYVHPPRAGSVAITGKIIRQIIALADRRRLNHQQVATELHTNMARVSEVLTIRELHRDGLDAKEIAVERPRISRKLIGQVLALLEEDEK